MCSSRILASSGAFLAALFITAAISQAQDLEPRTYANVPVGLNFLIAGYFYSEGGVATAAQSPPPQRYCKASPTMSKSPPIRVATALLA